MDEPDPYLDGLAAQLTASGDYRIQKRLRTRTIVTAEDGTPTRMGLFIDVETTGLDPQRDEVIELAMVPFTYSIDGRIFGIRRAFHGFQEPSAPISAAITKITGITDDMVAGHRIDPEEVRSFASGAALVIAHNAAFDGDHGKTGATRQISCQDTIAGSICADRR